MNKLKEKISEYMKVAEELKNLTYVTMADNRTEMDLAISRELRDRIMEGELDGARSERAIVEATAVSMARARLGKETAR